MGGSSSESAPSAAVEAPNSLLSTTNLRVVDLVCEGIISGFTLRSGAFGNNPLVSVVYDDVSVMNLDGSTNFNTSGQGFQFSYTFGTQNQPVITGFEKIENLIPLSSNTRIANPPPGAGAVKYVVASFNTNTYPDANAIKVTVRVPYLATADDQGNVNGYEIIYAVDISINNGPFIEQEQIDVRGKCTSPYLKDTVYTLPKTNPPSSFYEYKIRVRRVTQNILSNKTNNEIFVDSIAVISSSSFNYPNTVLVATEIAGDQFSALPTRAYDIQGLLLSLPSGYHPTTYHPDGTITQSSYPTIWDGTFSTGLKWSDNPAWILLDILTNTRYGLGQYLSVSSIDKWSLYEIAQYCDELIDDGAGGLEPRFTCNVVISERQDAYQLIQNLVSVFRGMVYFGNGRIFATQTDDKKAVYNYTNANVIEGKFSYSDTSTNVRSTVAMVKWNDPDNYFKETVEYIEDREGISRYGYIMKEVTAFACTSKGQAIRVGNWILQTEQALTETVTFQVGLDGLYIRPGDVFNIYDNFRTNQQQGGRVAIINPTRDTLTADRQLSLDLSQTYSLSAIVPASSFPTGITGSNDITGLRAPQIETRAITTFNNDDPSILIVDNPFSSNIFPGTVFVISASGTGTIFQNSTPYKCLAVSEPKPGIIEILGLIYDTGINNATETNYSTDNNPINAGDTTPIDPPTGLRLSGVTGAYTDNTFYQFLNISWFPTDSSNLAYYKVSGQPFGGSYSVIKTTTTTGYNYSFSVTGLHRFSVLAVSNGGIESDSITGYYIVPSTSPIGPPTTLSGIEIIEKNNDNYKLGSLTTGYFDTNPTLKWTIPTDSNGNEVVGANFISGYKLFLQRPSDGFTYANPFVLDGKDNLQFTIPENFSLTGLLSGAHRALHVFVQVLDTYGNATNGTAIDIDNPAPKPPLSSGFQAVRGGLNYNFTVQDIDATDVSGIYLWFNTGSTFVPTIGNVSFRSQSLAGLATNSQLSDYFTWFSILDSYGFTGCSIYGPVLCPMTYGITSGEALNLVSGASGVLQAEITGMSGAFNSKIAQFSGFVTGVSGFLDAEIALTGSQAWNAANNNGINLSGNLAASGSALITYINNVSGSIQGGSSTGTINLSNYEQVLNTISGKVHRWKFEDVSGSTFADSINGFTLTKNGNVTFSGTGLIGGNNSAVNFNNVAFASGLITSSHVPTGGALRSFVAVVKLTQAATVVSYGVSNTRQWFNAYIRPSPDLTLWADDLVANSFPGTDNNWHILGYGYDGNILAWSYADGTMSARSLGGTLNTSPSPGAPYFYLGFQSTLGVNALALIDDLVVISGYSLSKAQLDALYFAANGLPYH